MEFFNTIGSLLPFAVVAHKITAKSEGERQLCGTNRPFASATIARAAFARGRSTKISETQRFSPNQPFKRVEHGGNQNFFSLRPA
jgi:hypothetical protein